MSPQQALAQLWQLADGPPAALTQATIDGQDPVLPSIFRVGTAAAATAAATGLAATELWRQRTGRPQTTSVDMRAAGIAFRSERYLRINDGPPPNSWDELAGYYRTGDDDWVQLHTNFPHHRQGFLDLLDCEPTRAAIQTILDGWQGAAFEEEAVQRGLCAGLLRSTAQWRQHPHAAVLANLPLFEIERIDAADPQPLPSTADRPLAGVRVLDLTRVIAGPVCGRKLASHGATVMRVGAEHLPSIPSLVIESGRGKLSTHIDLRQNEGRQQLADLARQADIFVQGYRPGAIAEHGFSPRELARMRPGIICVSLSAFGRLGPWAGRRGFDSIVQTISGIAHAGGRAAGSDGPKPLPCQALDHASGFIAAFGAMMALRRRALEGGSWHVRLSLAQTGRWIESLGRIEGLDHPDPGADDIADLLQTADSPFGTITHVGSPVGLSETPPHWLRPPVDLGTHPPVWPELYIP
ncbi:MAG: CoA transferase [Candidatus Latescibacteria bacterium]|nr:CoA transferase [Candidatus Latescibacterota bacterium]